MIYPFALFSSGGVEGNRCAESMYVGAELDLRRVPTIR
jgi:hypothetical protein